MDYQGTQPETDIASTKAAPKPSHPIPATMKDHLEQLDSRVCDVENAVDNLRTRIAQLERITG